jgi:hypothetical protein
MEAICFSETSVDFEQTAWRYIAAMTSVSCKNRTEHISMLCGQNALGVLESTEEGGGTAGSDVTGRTCGTEPLLFESASHSLINQSPDADSVIK